MSDNNEITPTFDENSPTGVYIPSDLEDCFRELNKMLSASAIEEIRTCEESGLSIYHFGLGMWMRNNWGLWNQEARLTLYFDILGIQDADDVSSFILVSYWESLNGKPINIPRRIVYNKIGRDEIESGPKPSN